jgi:hypothetical protein
MNLPLSPLDLLRNVAVCNALSKAWTESHPGLSGGHEEGGFIVLNDEKELDAIRWPTGRTNTVKVPAHDDCIVHGREIVATFHTHPNTGPDYLQEPSETDRRGVRDDVELKGRLYVGEFVITEEMIYLVMPAGEVREMCSRTALFG